MQINNRNIEHLTDIPLELFNLFGAKHCTDGIMEKEIDGTSYLIRRTSLKGTNRHLLGKSGFVSIGFSKNEDKEGEHFNSYHFYIWNFLPAGYSSSPPYVLRISAGTIGDRLLTESLTAQYNFGGLSLLCPEVPLAAEAQDLAHKLAEGVRPRRYEWQGVNEDDSKSGYVLLTGPAV